MKHLDYPTVFVVIHRPFGKQEIVGTYNTLRKAKTAKREYEAPYYGGYCEILEYALVRNLADIKKEEQNESAKRNTSISKDR
jgi:hypothetical protein